MIILASENLNEAREVSIDRAIYTDESPAYIDNFLNDLKKLSSLSKDDKTGIDVHVYSDKNGFSLFALENAYVKVHNTDTNKTTGFRDASSKVLIDDVDINSIDFTVSRNNTLRNKVNALVFFDLLSKTYKKILKDYDIGGLLPILTIDEQPVTEMFFKNNCLVISSSRTKKLYRSFGNMKKDNI